MGSFALVLGAGGTVGLAYHAGVLRALENEGGLRADDAELVVGTSAGSVVAAYMRVGWTSSALWDLVMEERHLPPAPEPEAPALERLPRMFTTAFTTPVELVQRGIGSAYVLGRSMIRPPVPITVPAVLRHAFPAGLFEPSESRSRLDDDLSGPWPERPTWLCAVDIVSGRRIVLGRRRPPSIGLARSVAASCAIPGVYPPVPYGRRQLVDGGAYSTTNLDLAAGRRFVIAVAPMGFSGADGWCPLGSAVRAWANRSLQQEAAAARARGTTVVSFAPGRRELATHGMNMMRATMLGPVARSAYEATCRALERGALAGLDEAAA